MHRHVGMFCLCFSANIHLFVAPNKSKQTQSDAILSSVNKPDVTLGKHVLSGKR